MSSLYILDTSLSDIWFAVISSHSVACLSSEKATAPHSSTLAWKIPWMEELGGLQSMGSRRVGHDWATSLSFFTSMHWRRKWQPTPVFLRENPRDSGAWWAAVYGVTKSRIRLMQLSTSSSSSSRYAGDITPMAEREEKLKNLLMKIKKERVKILA